MLISERKQNQPIVVTLRSKGSDSSIHFKDCLVLSYNVVTKGSCQSVACIINGTVTGPNATLAPIVLLTT